MNVFHLLCQCSIHHPMPVQQSLPFKLFRNNLHFKTCTAPNNINSHKKTTQIV
ncbi:hypothetical protein HanPSC8_Chr15g0653641 [Helianthus annuus]|nr:hypothetical protein HanPSC8_Chr15g0653641 [Helianthus annuus]